MIKPRVDPSGGETSQRIPMDLNDFPAPNGWIANGSYNVQVTQKCFEPINGRHIKEAETLNLQ